MGIPPKVTAARLRCCLISAVNNSTVTGGIAKGDFRMTQSIADHWGTGDVYARIIAGMEADGIDPASVTVSQLAACDHFHARGFPATVELADVLPVEPHHHLVDIGCGVGGPARYLAERFGCRVSGVDITAPFIDAARKLTVLVGLEDKVRFELGDGRQLPYPEETFDGAICQHVTMNIEDRAGFFAEAARVLKPGGFFALSEHGLGPAGDPHHPVPWSSDGTGAFLVTPEETVSFLEGAGFTDIHLKETGPKYLAGYRTAMERAAAGTLPTFGSHILAGADAPAKTRNAARNIEEGRTRPIQVICRKAG